MTALRTAPGSQAALAALTALALWLAAATAAAADVPPTVADARHGKILYLQHCVACHGGRAWGDGPRQIPALAGQRADYLAAQLTRFASGARPGSAEHGPAMHDTLLRAPDVNRPAAIRDLAAYLAQAPALARADPGEGDALALGKSMYLAACSACHGADGVGREGATPRLAAQHYRYLLSRLREFGAVHGESAAGVTLSAAQQQALADYLARLPGGARTP